ncbi:hypothetical protein OOJ91_12220 [Micromonospora lupini]|uniref:hypothetical protein n=1 Tax=Micromonospora lupini TaxID=285679 RepID=UPI00224E2072|nr:hypothetical protein [Micromonospora lupini]MCX5066644.1 hypothetical protein [Micromonospora lupini]
MSRTPYTDSIKTQLGVDTKTMYELQTTHGDASPIGQCVYMIQSALWSMESAERNANKALTQIASITTTQIANLAGNDLAFDPSWLTTHAKHAAEAGAKLNAGFQQIETFKRLLDALTTATAAA